MEKHKFEGINNWCTYKGTEGKPCGHLPTSPIHAVEAGAPPEKCGDINSSSPYGCLTPQGHKGWHTDYHTIWDSPEANGASDPAASRESEREQIQAEIDLVRGWFEGHPDSAVIEELAARSVRFRESHAALVKDMEMLCLSVEQQLCMEQYLNNAKSTLARAKQLQPAPAQQEEE